MISERTRFARFLAQTSPEPIGLEIERAEGLNLITPSGKVYKDMISGISVSALGHGHPEVLEAVKAQSDKHMHLMVYGEFIQSPQTDFAEALVEHLPKPINKVYLVNSGSEAVEGALKLAKKATGRKRVISSYDAYHGSTHGALSLMGKEEMRRPFEPLPGPVDFLRYNHREDVELITDQDACVVLEAVQGEAGVRIPDAAFMQAIRQKCDACGVLLIMDEIQTAPGRCGSFLASTQYNVVPDIVCMAKSIGAGMPLGLFAASAELMDVLMDHPPLGHITTFGGHPVSCAAALAGIKVLDREKIIEQVPAKSELFKKRLQHPLVKEIRAAGLLMALQFEDEATNFAVIDQAMKKGILVDWFLFSSDSMRLAPPLIISNDEIEAVCAVLRSAMDAVQNT